MVKSVSDEFIDFAWKCIQLNTCSMCVWKYFFYVFWEIINLIILCWSQKVEKNKFNLNISSPRSLCNILLFSWKKRNWANCNLKTLHIKRQCCQMVFINAMWKKNKLFRRSLHSCLHVTEKTVQYRSTDHNWLHPFSSKLIKLHSFQACSATVLHYIFIILSS